MSALQDCQDYCGTSSNSACSCSLVNSVVYQKMMTIAGELLLMLLVLVVMKMTVCRTTRWPVLHHVLLWRETRRGPRSLPCRRPGGRREWSSVCRTVLSRPHLSAASTRGADWTDWTGGTSPARHGAGHLQPLEWGEWSAGAGSLHPPVSVLLQASVLSRRVG